MKTETTSTDEKNARSTAPTPAIPKNVRKRMPRPRYKSCQAIMDPKKCYSTETYIEPISEEVKSILYR